MIDVLLPPSEGVMNILGPPPPPLVDPALEAALSLLETGGRLPPPPLDVVFVGVAIDTAEEDDDVLGSPGIAAFELATDCFLACFRLRPW
jgi:hypothetical protein